MVIQKRTMTHHLLNTIHGQWGKEYFPYPIDGIPRQVGSAGLTFSSF